MRLIPLVLTLLCAASPVAAAERGTVVLLPAHTFKGAPANGPAVTAAFRANLEREGFRVAPSHETEAAMKRLSVDPTKRIFLPALTALGKELNARYVVYPSVQGVGIGVNQQEPEEFQATLLVNVADPEKNRLTYLYQIGQLFKHPDRAVERAVLPKEAANQAAQRLLEGFYKKTAPP